MDEVNYRQTVTKMREYQDDWFRNHNASSLFEAKRLEKIVDAENRRWLDEQDRTTVATAREERQLKLNLDEHIADIEFYHRGEDDETLLLHG